MLSMKWCILCVVNVDACVRYSVLGLECVGMHN